MLLASLLGGMEVTWCLEQADALEKVLDVG